MSRRGSDGPGVANECVETKDGLHVWEDHFYPEIVDPDTGAPLPDGEPGELVFTSLTRQAMPVIRYRTRDLTRLLPGTARPGFRRMEKVTGRSDDMTSAASTSSPSQSRSRSWRGPGCRRTTSCVLTRERPIDAMTVAVECGVRARRGGTQPAAAAR